MREKDERGVLIKCRSENSLGVVEKKVTERVKIKRLF